MSPRPTSLISGLTSWRGRNLREADRARERRHGLLVRREPVGVHEDDGAGPDAIGEGAPPARCVPLEVERRLDRAVGQHALGNLDDALVELLGLLDLLGEDVGAGLVADPQRIAETARGHEHGAVALALEQGIGGHRGAHLDRVECARPGSARPGATPRRSRMPCEGGVAISLRVFREQLPGVSLPSGIAARRRP